jgi:hypothetical protein
MVSILIFGRASCEARRAPPVSRSGALRQRHDLAQAWQPKRIYFVGEPKGLPSLMRAIIFILIIAVLAGIAAFATGFLNISQTRDAQAPNVAATGSGVSAKGGQAPAFDVQTGSLKVGAKDRNVTVPTLQVQKPEDQQAAATNNAQ